MKNTKRIFSLLIVICMTLSLILPVFAVNGDTEKGSIELTNPIEGTKYKAYKIFDVSYDGANYAYTIAEDSPWYATVSTFAATTGSGLTLAEVKDGSTTTTYNVTVDKEEFSAAAFAEALKKVSSKPSDGVELTKTKDNTVKAENLSLGYWFVDPTVGALASLTTTDKDVTIVDKNEEPAVDKVIDDAEPDSDGIISQANIGDEIPFTLTTKIPDMTGYKKYFFVFNDTLSKGLTFNEDSVVVTLEGKANALVKDTDYSVKTTVDSDGVTTVRVVMNDMIKNYSDDVGKKLVLKYNATLNTEAVIDGANTNTARMEFSNDPTFDPQYDPEDPPEDPNDPEDPKNDPDPNEPGNATGKGPESQTFTYTTQVTINKVDELGAKLLGAKFRLEGKNGAGNIIKTTGDNYIEYAPIPYYEISETKYVDEGSTGLDEDKNLYEPKKYAKYIDTTTSNANYKEYTDEDVEYKLKENLGEYVTVAPTKATESLYDLTNKAYTRSGAGSTADPFNYEPYTEPTVPQIYYRLNDGSFTTTAPTAKTWSTYEQEDFKMNEKNFDLDKVTKYIFETNDTYSEFTAPDSVFPDKIYYKYGNGTYTEEVPTAATLENYDPADPGVVAKDLAKVKKYYKDEYVKYVAPEAPTLYYKLKNTITSTTIDPKEAPALIDPTPYIKIDGNLVKIEATSYKQIYTTDPAEAPKDAEPQKMVWLDGTLEDYKELPNPAYYPLKDGTFTEDKPTDATFEKYIYETTADGKVCKVYQKIEEYDYDTKATTPEVAEAFVKEVNGKAQLVFSGLGAGEYTLTEIVTPDGYNTIDPITLTIKFDIKNADSDATDIEFFIDELANDKDKDGKKDSDFLLEMNIVNVNGMKLPETGGKGKILLIALGSVLFIATAIILVAKKKVYNEGAESIVDIE